MSVRRALLLLPVILLLFLGGAYLLLDAWLESAGGRRALERALSERSGWPISLNGEFDIVLLPSPGVSGTELLVLDPLRGDVLARGGGFGVSLELMPLLREQLEIRYLTVSDLQLGPPEAAFHIVKLGLGAYAENRPTNLRADLGELGRIEGGFTWFPARVAVEFAFDWTGPSEQAGALASTVSWDGARFSLADIRAGLAGQRVAGHGCFVPGSRPVLNLELSSDALNLDTLAAALPATGGEGGPVNFEWPFELNLIMQVQRLDSGDTRAEGVTLELGGPPSCAD